MGVLAINSAVLRWAREERRLTKEAAAERLKISVEQLDALENGSHIPNVTELRRIASKYEITFAALLMPEPLPSATRPAIRDFRTHGGLAAQYDHDMIVELEDVNQQLNLLADLRDDAPEIFGMRDLPVASVNDDPMQIAIRERTNFGVPITRQLGWENARHAFLAFRDLIEAKGIFVYARNLGPPRNCRGLSILDDRQLPAIVVNSNNEEEYAPRNFTLMHEYAHVVIRQTGISDENRQDVHERFCNQFAAEFLMPRDAFRREARSLRPDSAWTDRDITRLANRFKVSKEAVAIHLETLGLARSGLYAAFKREWRLRNKRPSKAIATYQDKIVNRYGVRHIELVFRALDERKIDELDAHEMLEGVKTKYFESVRESARERHEAYGGGK